MQTFIFTIFLLVWRIAFGASAQLPQAQRNATGSLSLARRSLYEDVTAKISSGTEFVQALRNPTVSRVLLTAPVVDVPVPAWNASGEQLPIIISRSVTIEGDPQLPDWPTLEVHFVKGMVRLGDGVTLKFWHMVLDGGRDDNPTRVPGLDMLSPTLVGQRSTLFLGTAAMTTQACFPEAYQWKNMKGLARPAGVPGEQQYLLSEPQVGCINRTDVPYIRRCWADKSIMVDVVAEGADNIRGLTVPNNILLIVRNFTAFCRVRASEACIAQGEEPLVCYVRAARSASASTWTSTSTAASTGGSAGGGGAAAASAADQPLTTSSGAASTGGSGVSSPPSSSSSRKTIVALCVSLGGGFIVATAAVVVVMLRNRRRRHRAASSSLRHAAASASSATPPINESESEFGTASGGAPSAAAPMGYNAWSGTAPNGGAKGALVDAATGVSSPSPGCRCGGDKFGDALAASLDLTTAAAAVEEARADTLSGSSSRYRDCTEEATLPRSEDAERSSGTTEDLKAPYVSCGGGGHSIGRRDSRYGGGGGGGIDAPVTPYMPHRPSLTLGVEVRGAPTDGVHQHFQNAAGGAAAYPSSGGIRVYSVDSTTSHTLVGGSCDDAAAAGAPAGGGGGSSGGGASGSGRPEVVELLPVVLGKGAFGRVHQGMYGGQRVAVKVMASQHSWGGGASCIRSFAQEVQVLGRCQHPNIVRLLAAAMEPPNLCLVMELMETSLERLLHADPSRPPIPMHKVLHIGIAVASALAYMHPTIVHRDLKPANVLIDNAGSDRPTVKISDFGLARLRVTAVPTESPEAGTPAYMAPECFDVTNNLITHKADMFSFGVLLWEMLSGERPWWKIQPVTVALMISHHGSRLPLSRLPLDRRPMKLTKLISACWDADPTRRPAAAETAKELAVMLQELSVNTIPATSSVAIELMER